MSDTTTRKPSARHLARLAAEARMAQARNQRRAETGREGIARVAAAASR